MLITPEFGSRQRLVSVFTALELEGDMMTEKELCNKCRLCERACPTKAFSGESSDRFAKMDEFACVFREEKYNYKEPYIHCGYCSKVCPAGEDRKPVTVLNIL